MTAIRLQAGEVRNLGSLRLEVGTASDEATVTAEVTPVQLDSSARFGVVTADQLTNVQMRGRDSLGLVALVPGGQDNNLNRRFMSWRSGQRLTINGARSNTGHHDRRLHAHDEGGTGNALVNPNNDAIGEIQVIANGFTAENRRNMGGLSQEFTDDVRPTTITRSNLPTELERRGDFSQTCAWSSEAQVLLRQAAAGRQGAMKGERSLEDRRPTRDVERRCLDGPRPAAVHHM